ncbi:MAG: hypothetical protein KDE27_23785 [Planctomycetes bacterium]|nr:hypothetical protein [Planctomycetota bacterium]
MLAALRPLAVPALAAFLLAQDPQPTPAPAGEPPAAEAEKPAAAPPVEQWDDRRAKDAVRTLTKVFKAKTSSMRDRSLALDELATAANKAFVKPLADIVANDKSVVIRRRAAELLGRQPAKEGNRAIVNLLDDGDVQAEPNVAADLVKSLSKCGYTAKNWETVGELFESEYAIERVPLQEAILELVIAHKEKQAIPVLLRNIDEPVPSDVHGQNNPPAAYWEARWKSWNSWRLQVKEALFAITGQRFSSAKEAKIWLDKNKLE